MSTPAGLIGADVAFSSRSIAEAFRDSVAAYRDRDAVLLESGSVTYGELDRQANGIAREIASAGTAPGQSVVIMMSQGAAAIAAILGALKAGCRYVPLNPAKTAASLRAKIDAADAAVVLADRRGRAACAGACRAVIDLDGGIPRHPDAPDVSLLPDDDAYIFFTSGTTGAPKGVVDTHRNVLHNVYRYACALGIGPADRMSLIQPVNFSGTVSTLFGALVNGAAVAPYDIAGRGLLGLGRFVRSAGLTMFHAVPTLFRAMVNGEAGFPALRVVRLEGDSATEEDIRLARRSLAGDAILAVGLGATETGLVCQWRRRVADLPSGQPPIGEPVTGVAVEIVGESGEPVRDGEPGEIVVRSRYLAKGYWKDPDRTAAAFSGTGDDRQFRTGDIGVRKADALLFHLGRADARRTFRGEWLRVREVEARLCAIDGIAEAYVEVQSRGGREEIVAYLVAPGQVHPARLRKALASMPGTERPSRLLRLERPPCGPGGKVDRRALPAPDSLIEIRLLDGEGPRDDLEREIAAAWRDALGRMTGRSVTLRDAGADSLDVSRIAAAITKRTGFAVTESMLATHPSVAEFAEMLRAERGVSTAHGAFCLQREGDGPPLFIVPGHRGGALSFAGLAGQIMNHPVYLLDGRANATTVSEIARTCLALARSIQPGGPLHVMGYCSGAAIACAMAGAEDDKDGSAAVMYIVDAGPTEFRTLMSPDDVARYRRAVRRASVRGHVRALRREGFDWLRLAWRRHSSARLAPKGLPGGSLRPVSCDLHIFAGERLLLEGYKSPGSSWKRVTSGSVHIHPLRVQDGAIKDEAAIQELARALNAVLPAPVLRLAKRTAADIVSH